MTEPGEIAQWLIHTIRENGPRRTRQDQVVREIRERFGEEWSYRNANGNWAIDRRVLQQFQPLKDELIVWNRGDQSWSVYTQEKLDRERERDQRRDAVKRERDAARAAQEAERAERDA